MNAEVERARMIIRDARAEFADQQWAQVELAESERRLDEPLRVALVGKLKSGKSTLLNALVGEEIAPTDATECTRVVTWFARSGRPFVAVDEHGGRRVPLPVRREDGRLRLELGSVPADRVDRLVVGWPSSLLDRFTIIDTPGTSSNNADVSARTMAFLTPDQGTCPAEAIIFLMRSRHDSDVELLREIQRSAGGGGPLGIVGVLSRADEVESGTEQARRRGEELRSDPELAGLHRDFVAVSGLLAVRGQTLRQSEFVALCALARLPDDRLASALISAGRFTSVDVPVSVADRQGLLEGFSLVGIRTAIKLIRAGARDAPALAAELVRHSGLDELREVLRVRFAGRHGQLKAQAALAGARRVLLRLPAARAARLLRGVERLLADTTASDEPRVLASLSSLAVPEPTRQALYRVLGGQGLEPATRLGLPPDADPARLRTTALHALAHWHTQLEDPLLDRTTEQAFRAAVRGCEAIVSAASRTGTAGSVAAPRPG